jgi:hypothetical protein
MELERTFDRLSDLLQDLAFPSVRTWKQQQPGGHAVALVPVDPPVASLHAAGM